MRSQTKLFLLMCISFSLSAGNWVWPEKIELGLEKLGLEDATEMLTKRGIPVHVGPETLKAFADLNENIEKLSEKGIACNVGQNTFDALAEFRKSCVFAFIGLCFASCGMKLLYDSCKDIQAKLSDKENEEQPWYKVLGWRDAISPVVGLVDLGIGYKIISES